MLGGAGLVVIGGWYFFSSNVTPGRHDTLAKCLKDKGAILYGTFGCSHCQNQKALFGKSSQFLPYVECSTPDGNNVREECVRAGVKGYPTWQFPDGSRELGEMSLRRLSEKTSCPLPQ